MDSHDAITKSSIILYTQLDSECNQQVMAVSRLLTAFDHFHHRHQVLLTQTNNSVGCLSIRTPQRSCSVTSMVRFVRVQMDRVEPDHAHFVDDFVICILELVIINLCAKFQVPMFTHYSNTKGKAKCTRNPAVCCVA